MRRLFLMVALACGAPASAQLVRSSAAPADKACVVITAVDGRPACAEARVQVDVSGVPIGATNPVPVATNGKQESYNLIDANSVAPAQTVYGGSYVFSQSCSGYGTVTLRYRGPDGATMQVLVTKTATDAAGGTLVSLASYVVVDATVSGTTGCNATIARVP